MSFPIKQTKKNRYRTIYSSFSITIFKKSTVRFLCGTGPSFKTSMGLKMLSFETKKLAIF